MASTLSISKKTNWVSFYCLTSITLLLGGGFSCSAPIKKVEQTPTYTRDKPPKIETIYAGPSITKKVKGFQNVSKALGLDSGVATHLYAVDWSGDGQVDLVTLPEFYGTPVFYEYKSGKFVISNDSPLPPSVRASFLVFADFNKDGRLDVIVTTLNQKSELNQKPLRLFMGIKKKAMSFEEVQDAFPSKAYATSTLSLIDINMDGWLDIYLGNWFDTTKSRPKPQPDRIFLGKPGGKKWQDGTYLLQGELKFDRENSYYPNARPTFGSSVCDIDKNGYPDILTASASGHANKVWLNLYDKENKDRILKDYGAKTKLSADNDGFFSPTGGGNSSYMLCQDYNNDGFLDVAMGELFHSYDPESRDRSSIMTGTGLTFPPKFIRTEYHKDDGSGSWSQGDRRAIWADLNFDGNVDLLVENSGFPPKSRLVYFEQADDHGLADRAKDYGIDIVNPSGSVTLDYNRDGRLDLIMGQVTLRDSRIKPNIYAYKNNFEREGRRVLKIELQGKKANAHGLGALVVLKTSKASYSKVVDPSYGPLNSQNEFGLWFGLKKGERIIEAEVRWPLERETKTGKKYPVRYTYRLKNLNFKNHLSIILKDDGSFKGD